LSVPRAPGEASGGICRLEHPDGRDVTISIEYNVLGSLLAPQGGDVAGTDGNSPYPGNCNILLFDLDSTHINLNKHDRVNRNYDYLCKSNNLNIT
jgi:hypothetical protein